MLSRLNVAAAYTAQTDLSKSNRSGSHGCGYVVYKVLKTDVIEWVGKFT
jgi:hypothetical protein